MSPRVHASLPFKASFHSRTLITASSYTVVGFAGRIVAMLEPLPLFTTGPGLVSLRDESLTASGTAESFVEAVLWGGTGGDSES